MPGIIVGIDGSGHSRRALEWAMKEAALRHAPLTVLTVYPAIAGFFGDAAVHPGGPEATDRTREAAQAETDKVLVGLDGPRPESVTVKAVHGFTVEEIIKAARDADMLVLGSRGAGGFARMVMGSTCYLVAHHAPCPVLIVRSEDRK